MLSVILFSIHLWPTCVTSIPAKHRKPWKARSGCYHAGYENTTCRRVGVGEVLGYMLVPSDMVATSTAGTAMPPAFTVCSSTCGARRRCSPRVKSSRACSLVVSMQRTTVSERGEPGLLESCFFVVMREVLGRTPRCRIASISEVDGSIPSGYLPSPGLAAVSPKHSPRAARRIVARASGSRGVCSGLTAERQGMAKKLLGSIHQHSKVAAILQNGVRSKILRQRRCSRSPGSALADRARGD